MADNKFWWGVVLAHEDARLAAARRKARRARALRRSGSGRFDPARAGGTSPLGYLVMLVGIAVGVWLWLR